TSSADAVAAHILCDIKHLVRAAIEILRGLAPVPYRKPDTDGNAMLCVVNVDFKPRYLLANSIGRLDHQFRVNVRCEDCKFLPAQPGDDVMISRVIPEAPRHLLQYDIANIVPVSIVHGLEVIEVDNH